MRAGRSFRVILDTEGGNLQVLHSFKRIVIQVYVRKLHRHVRERVRIYAEAVILCSDLDFACCEVFYGLICPTVSELEFECTAPERKSHHLVPQTDAENRFFPEQLSNGFDNIMYRGRVAW